MTATHKFPMLTVSFDLTSSVEHRVESLHRAGDYLHWLLLDTAGTLAVHLAISRIRARIARIVGQIGACVRGRISPGHGDWPLQDQAALFSLFGTASLPVRLLDKGLMMPGKSMSGLMAITPFPLAAPESGQEDPGDDGANAEGKASLSDLMITGHVDQ